MRSVKQILAALSEAETEYVNAMEEDLTKTAERHKRDVELLKWVLEGTENTVQMEDHVDHAIYFTDDAKTQYVTVYHEFKGSYAIQFPFKIMPFRSEKEIERLKSIVEMAGDWVYQQKQERGE